MRKTLATLLLMILMINQVYSMECKTVVKYVDGNETTKVVCKIEPMDVPTRTIKVDK